MFSDALIAQAVLFLACSYLNPTLKPRGAVPAPAVDLLLRGAHLDSMNITPSRRDRAVAQKAPSCLCSLFGQRYNRITV